MIHDSSDRTFFKGVIVTRFDLMLGPSPAVILPRGFVTDEVARNVAEDVMLLLSTGEKGTVYSMMYFNGVRKIGVVGVNLNQIDTATGVITMFDEEAGGMIWGIYPLIRSFVVREMRNVRHEPTNVALRLFGTLQKLCGYLEGKRGLEALTEKLEMTIEKTIPVVNSLSHSERLGSLETHTPDARARIARLVTVLEESKTNLKKS